jgi:hypothetical protein
MDINWNSILVGIILGLVLPFVGYALLLEFNGYFLVHPISLGNNAFDGFSDRLLGILAICLNLLPFNYFRKSRYDDGLRGVVFPTVLYVGVWMVYFGSKLL